MGIKVENLCLNYGDLEVIKAISLEVEKEDIVTIVGPNGCGKSSLLKAISRCKKPKSGKIYLEGENIFKLPTKALSRKMAYLPQVKDLVGDMSVGELTSYGRYPHLSFLGRLAKEDREIVDWALEVTGLKNLKDRNIKSLSGGERQRAWLAMALCQSQEYLLLDEPTSYLDISYQIDFLDLVLKLNKDLGLTVVMVLHDLNQAARYSDRLLFMKEGRVYKEGSVKECFRTDFIEEVFRIEGRISIDRQNNCPYFIPDKKLE